MSLFTKPCGCRGIGLFQKDYTMINVRRLWINDDEFETPFDIEMPECGTSISRSFSSYSSTEIIEMQEEKEKIERENWVKTIKKRYLLYGCLKCGDTWREHYKSRTSRDWKGEA